MLPTPKKIKLAGEDNSLAVEWSDGHRSSYPYRYLRDKCPCATCTGAHGAMASPALVNPTALPMFEKRLQPERAELVGRYAVQMYWSDGHSTGIYSFGYLRELCPCGECRSPEK